MSSDSIKTILDIVESQREEYCRFDDYIRYAKHLSRKLHTARKSKQTGLTLTYLYASERAWANAMHQRTLHAKKQLILSKLRKAYKYAGQLIQLNKDDAQRHLHALIYHDYIYAMLSQERDAYEQAISSYSRALIALQRRGSPLLESVEAGLRFVLYQHDSAQSSVNLQQFALANIEQDSSDKEWSTLLREVEPAALDEERGDEMVTNIEWVGYNAQLSDAELSAAISSAISGRRSLNEESDANAYDNVLASWTNATRILATLIAKEDDPNRTQELEIISAWLQYHSLRDRIARNKALVALSATREALLLSNGTEKLYKEILDMPSLSQENTTTIQSELRELRGDRSVILSKNFKASLEALALLNDALQYYDPSSKRHKTVTAELQSLNSRYILSAEKKVWFDAQSWYTGNLKRLRDLDASDLISKGVTLKPVVFDIAWNYISGQYVDDTVAAVKAVPEIVSATVEDVAKPVKKGFFGLFGSR